MVKQVAMEQEVTSDLLRDHLLALPRLLQGVECWAAALSEHAAKYVYIMM